MQHNNLLRVREQPEDAQRPAQTPPGDISLTPWSLAPGSPPVHPCKRLAHRAVCDSGTSLENVPRYCGPQIHVSSERRGERGFPRPACGRPSLTCGGSGSCHHGESPRMAGSSSHVTGTHRDMSSSLPPAPSDRGTGHPCDFGAGQSATRTRPWLRLWHSCRRRRACPDGAGTCVPSASSSG